VEEESFKPGVKRKERLTVRNGNNLNEKFNEKM